MIVKQLTITASLVAVLSVSPVAFAAEAAGPGATHQRETSKAEEFSLKPVRLYSSRGRRDPFVMAKYYKAIKDPGNHVNPSPVLEEISISRLDLTGFTEANSQIWALFVEKGKQRSYVLKAGKFYTSGGKLIKLISGTIKPTREVVLMQGNRKMKFTKFVENRRNR